MDDQALLYDPLFETPPDTVIRDTPGRGFWGKAVVKKTAFVLAMVLFVGAAIVMSFSSLSKDRFSYKEADGGWELDEFIAAKTDAVLHVGPVFNEDDSTRPGERTVSVRTFAVCGNEYTWIILVDKDVLEIPNTAFYSCTSLLAVLVDPENPNYYSDNGVLYRTENGKPAEVMLCPAKNDLYRAMLAQGETPPADDAAAAAFAEKAKALDEKSRDWIDEQKKDEPEEGLFGLTAAEAAARQEAFSYDILPGVTRVGEMAFAECGTLKNITIPDTVTRIDTMAFFKCGNLRSIRIPDGVETIGSDAFSYCVKAPYIFIPASVKEIGHHAFWDCGGVSEIYMACSEENAPVLGQDWLPKYRKLFLHDIPVVYNAERRDG